MDRLQRKCAIVSAGLHLLLASILIFGPGFLVPTQKSGTIFRSSESPDLRFFELVPLPPDESRSQPAQSVVQKPTTSSQPQPTFSGESKLPKISTTPVNRYSGAAASKTSNRNAQLDRITKIINGVRGSHAGATTIETSSVADGRDDDYARFVRDTYTSNWDLTGAESDSAGALTRVTVTIASSGKVLSWRVLRSSGSTQVDQTVERTLKNVDFIRPVGEGAKEPQRTYTINFNCNARQP